MKTPHTSISPAQLVGSNPGLRRCQSHLTHRHKVGMERVDTGTDQDRAAMPPTAAFPNTAQSGTKGRIEVLERRPGGDIHCGRQPACLIVVLCHRFILLKVGEANDQKISNVRTKKDLAANVSLCATRLARC